jgi:chromate transporter
MAGESAGAGGVGVMTPTLRALTWVIARDVNRTIGGGMAAMELMRRSFEVRRWVEASTHGLFVAVSRLTPGTNVLAYCAAVGWRLQGWRGTLAAVAAASIPGSLVVFALTSTLVRLDRYPAVRVALSLGMIVAAVLVFSSAWSLLKPYLRAGTWPRTLWVVAVAASLSLAGLTPVRVLLVAALVGAVLPTPRGNAA